MSTTDCSTAKNWGPVYFKRSALLGRIKNRICLVRRTAFILALDSPGRTRSMLSRYIFHDLDSSLAKSTRYKLVQFLNQPFVRYDSSTTYSFPRSISRWGFWSGLHSQQVQHFRFSEYPTPRATSLADKMSLCRSVPILRPILCQTRSSISFSLSVSMTKTDTTFSLFFGGIFTEANAKYPRRILKAINNAKTIRTCCVEARTRSQAS